MSISLSERLSHFLSQSITDAVLSPSERLLALISACTAKGDMPALRELLPQALAGGLSIAAIRDIMTQLYAYCGFPRALNALGELFAAAQGADDEPTPAPLLPDALGTGTRVQTELCGREVKGPFFDFAPAIDCYLKAHLFGDIFSSPLHTRREREVATIAALAAMQGAELQLQAHIGIGKHNGLSDEAVSAILALAAAVKHEDAFPLGSAVDGSVFTGEAWVQHLTHDPDYDTATYNVTFAPGTRNFWHAHTHGQILLCTVGEGLYQERGKKARRLHPGDVVEIPADVEHWHGAAPHSTFVHIGITPRVSENKNTWLEPVDDAAYQQAAQD